jgi:hypothetical protein
MAHFTGKARSSSSYSSGKSSKLSLTLSSAEPPPSALQPLPETDSKYNGSWILLLQLKFPSNRICAGLDIIHITSTTYWQMIYSTSLLLRIRKFHGSISAALMMEAANRSETSVNICQTTRRNNLEESHLHTRRRENLKSHLFNFCAMSVLCSRSLECIDKI